MMTLEQVRAALSDRRLTDVARATGMSYDTVWRIANNHSPAVSYESVRRLSNYLQAREAANG